MECSHCYSDMVYIANDNWNCDNCHAHALTMAIYGLHYFSDGRVHKLNEYGKCIPSINI